VIMNFSARLGGILDEGRKISFKSSQVRRECNYAWDELHPGVRTVCKGSGVMNKNYAMTKECSGQFTCEP